MNCALDYIEAHLTGEIHYKELAKAAQCSTYTFQRFFTYISGISLSEYIRRRRLSSAALDLQSSDIKIIDLAVKYGYESAISFSRAFQALQGVTPTKARSGHILKSYPRLSFNLSIKGNSPLDYQIISKAKFKMVGIKEIVSKIDDKNLHRIPELWRSHYMEKMELAKLSKELKQYVYGVTMNFTDNSFDYYIATMTDEITKGYMKEIKIPKATWAVFKCIGSLPDAQYNMWRRIFTEWLPFSGYTLLEIPEIEWYSDGDIYSSTYESEIWLPVQKDY